MAIANDCFEIISADSVQVYKFFDIGSGKPLVSERKGIEHYCIDVVAPDYPFSVGDFCREAKKACDSILNKKKIPLFVGGTGLYIDSFFKGIADIPSIDEGIRKSIKEDLNNKGLDELYKELKSIDNELALKIHPNDTQRILRGLEVFKGTGKPLSSYHKNNKGHESEDTIYIGLHDERAKLRDRIDKRVDLMIEKGFVEEVQSIRSKGFGPYLKSMKTIGYNEVNQFIDKVISFDQMVENIKITTKKYAKRQMTWFRKNNRIKWFNPLEKQELLTYIKKIF